jgi:hypothetical protein
MCLVCEKAITSEGMNSVVKNMGKHVKKPNHIMKQCSLEATTTADRIAFVAKSKRNLIPVARAFAVHKEDVIATRHLLAPYLMKPSTFWYCIQCDSYSEKKQNHISRHRATMVKKLAHFVIGCRLIIPADYDALKDANYSKFFRELLEEAKSELQGRSIRETERNIYSSVARRSAPVELVPQAKRRKKETKVRSGPDPFQFHLPLTPLVPEFKLPQGVLEAIFKFDSLAGGKY